MKPVVDRLRNEFAGRVDVKLMDTGSGDPEVERLGQQLGLEYVPTFVFTGADGTVVEQVVGTMDESAFRAKIQALLK